MRPKVQVKFLDKDKFEVNAVLSQTQLYVDHKAQDQAAAGPNPLELFLSALGSCMGIFSKRYLTNHNIDFKKLEIEVEADFVTQNPMRLDNIKVKVSTDANLGDNREAFLRFINNCPIHNTILRTQNIQAELEL